MADSRNNRIQKFDAQGRFVGMFGGGGGSPGRFNEPWSVAVDGDGFIYVADTWNHRIQKFSPDFTFVAAWGEPYVGPNPGPLRAVRPARHRLRAGRHAVGHGHRQQAHRSTTRKTGQLIRSIGSGGNGLGQFDEPVGLAFDAAGSLLRRRHLEPAYPALLA